MISTFTFYSSKSRDDFINIINELWFNFTTNTYTKTTWSKSDVSPHIFWNGSNIKTTNNTITLFEVTLDKDLTEEEEIKLNKLFQLFKYRKSELKFWALIIISLVLWIVLSLAIAYLLDNFLWLLDFNKYTWLPNITIIWSIAFVFYKLFVYMDWDIEKKEAQFQESKNYLIENYVWENWKRIISKL